MSWVLSPKPKACPVPELDVLSSQVMWWWTESSLGPPLWATPKDVTVTYFKMLLSSWAAPVHWAHFACMCLKMLLASNLKNKKENFPSNENALLLFLHQLELPTEWSYSWTSFFAPTCHNVIMRRSPFKISKITFRSHWRLCHFFKTADQSWKVGNHLSSYFLNQVYYSKDPRLFSRYTHVSSHMPVQQQAQKTLVQHQKTKKHHPLYLKCHRRQHNSAGGEPKTGRGLVYDMGGI